KGISTFLALVTQVHQLSDQRRLIQLSIPVLLFILFCRRQVCLVLFESASSAFRFQDAAAFLRKVRCGFDEVPTAGMRRLERMNSSSRSDCATRRSHIWMGCGSSLARFANRARFSPACLRPQRTALRKTDPTLRQSDTPSPSRRSRSAK